MSFLQHLSKLVSNFWILSLNALHILPIWRIRTTTLHIQKCWNYLFSNWTPYKNKEDRYPSEQEVLHEAYYYTLPLWQWLFPLILLLLEIESYIKDRYRDWGTEQTASVLKQEALRDHISAEVGYNLFKTGKENMKVSLMSNQKEPRIQFLLW